MCFLMIKSMFTLLSQLQDINIKPEILFKYIHHLFYAIQQTQLSFTDKFYY